MQRTWEIKTPQNAHLLCRHENLHAALPVNLSFNMLFHARVHCKIVETLQAARLAGTCSRTTIQGSDKSFRVAR